MMESYQIDDLSDVVNEILLGREDNAMRILSERFTAEEMVDVHNIYWKIDQLAQLVWMLKGAPDSERLLS